MGAEKLSAKCMLVTAPKKGLEPIIKVLEKNQIEVIDLALSSFGDYEELHQEINDDEVGAVVNIGSDKTEVSIFNKGVITTGEVINMGAINIDKDLSYIYKIVPSDAKKVKEELALCHTNMAQPNEYLECEAFEDGKVRLNQYEVSEIMMERIKEIFNLVKKQINLLTKKEISYIIISGGVTETQDFDILIEEILGEKGIIGKVDEIGARNNKYGTAVGMIKYYNSRMKLRNVEYSIFNLEEQEELGGVGKRLNVSENSILGKLFGYFFDN